MRELQIVVPAAMILGLWLFAPWTGAIEVSLEENKFEKGSIGYVDMHAIFRMFPETAKARLSFEDAMHQTEEQVNFRHAEIIGLKADISRLQVERDFFVKSSSTLIVGISPNDETSVSRSTATAHASEAVSVSSAADPPPNIPGAAGPYVLMSSATAASPSDALLLVKIQEIDRSIADKTKLLEAKEADFKSFENLAEKSLLDLESRKTEVLLGRIYGAIQEVAKIEDVSVVVDKSQILFGHRAVDLTDKVLQKLKSQ